MDDIRSLKDFDYERQSLSRIAESYFKETGTATK